MFDIFSKYLEDKIALTGQDHKLSASVTLFKKLSRHRFLFLCFFLIIFIPLFSCNASRHNKNGVELAMKQYDHLILKLDADSIALLYTPDGDMGGIAHGRDSIRNFLLTFKNLRVLSQSSNTSFIKMSGDSSLQKGTYHQTVIVAGKDTLNVKGEYTATWIWISKSGWHIKRMETRPL